MFADASVQVLSHPCRYILAIFHALLVGHSSKQLIGCASVSIDTLLLVHSHVVPRWEPCANVSANVSFTLSNASSWPQGSNTKQAATMNKIIHCSLQDVFEVLYREDNFIRGYHAHKRSHNVRISEWEQQQRTVQFELVLRGHAMVASLVGAPASATAAAAAAEPPHQSARSPPAAPVQAPT